MREVMGLSHTAPGQLNGRARESLAAPLQGDRRAACPHLGKDGEGQGLYGGMDPPHTALGQLNG